MLDARYEHLSDRSVIRVSGEDADGFLQGLITNDLDLATESQAIYAALLTPQGKYLHDFFVLQSSDAYLLDCQKQRRDDLITRLTRYRLRAKVEIDDLDGSFDCFAMFGDDAIPAVGLKPELGNAGVLDGGFAFVDPRRIDLGVRGILPTADFASPLEQRGFTASTALEYDLLRLSFGVADGYPEIEPEKSYPMDYGLDDLNGVSFTKGCYVGQEVTARMKSRDLVRKCLVPVRIDGPALTAGSIIHLANSVAGELRSVVASNGLALIKIDALEKAQTDGLIFDAGDTKLVPAMPTAKDD
jgi:folate-binding protein YgfZ